METASLIVRVVGRLLQNLIAGMFPFSSRKSKASDGSIALIKRSQIPSYLHSSALFGHLTDNDYEVEEDSSDVEDNDEFIPIPTSCMKMDLSLYSLDDLRHLLSTLRYWSSPDIPDELIAFAAKAVTKDSEKVRQVLEEYVKELSYLDALLEVAVCTNAKDCLRVAAIRGNMTLLQHMHLKFQQQGNHAAHADATNEMSSVFCTVAAEHGQLDALKFLLEHDYPMSYMALERALEKRHHDCALYAIQQGCRLPDQVSISNTQYKLTAALAMLGYVDCMELVRSKGVRLTNTCTVAAAKAGHVDMLRYLHTTGAPWTSSNIALEAARHGHLECLIYAHENGCFWDHSCCTAAAQGGHLSCLRYAHQNGCPWTSQTMNAAISHKDCLLYCRDNNCPWDAGVIKTAVQKDDIDTVKFLHEVGGCPLPEDVSCTAAANGNVELLHYLHEHGAQLKRACCTRAAAGGHLKCLKYLFEMNCPCDDMTTALAARNGHLECLQHAREHGCPWDTECCTWAAGNGNLECLQYAHEHGCQWDEWTTKAAAGGNHLHALKYLHEKGCPWNSWTTAAACQANFTDCLRYAIENGCSFDKETLEAYRLSESGKEGGTARKHRWFNWPCT